MKKIMITALCAFGFATANAQYDQGAILLTGGLNFGTSSTKTTIKSQGTTEEEIAFKSTDFSIDLMGGYFVADNLAVGLGFGFGSSSLTFDPDTEFEETMKTNLITIMPFARYYIPYTNQVAFFGEAALGYSTGKMKDIFGEEEDVLNVSGLSFGIQPGFSLMLTDNIAFEMKYGFLGYVSSTLGVEDGDFSAKQTTSNFGLNFDLSTLRLGLAVILGN